MNEVKDGEAGPPAAGNSAGPHGQSGRDPLAGIPVIDLSPFVTNGRVADRVRVAGEIRKACIDIGFFYLTGHGIPVAELDESVAWTHRLFELPLEEKLGLGKNAAGMGYVVMDAPEPESDRLPDNRELFVMTRESWPDEPHHPRNPAGKSRWPSRLPGFEAFMKPHIERRVQLTRDMLHAFSASLGLPEQRLDAAHRYLLGNLTLNYYPATDPAKHDRRQWGITPHTDYGTFTLLYQDAMGGLEVCNAAGDWVAVPPVPGAFVVNIGDMFARWTNDLYVSTLHRALNFGHAARVSIPFFVVPDLNGTIECLESCHGSGNPARYDPVRVDEYFFHLLDQSRRHGRASVSAQAAARGRAPPD